MTAGTMRRYVTATRYGLLEQWRNRFALVLLVLFVPAYSMLILWVIPNSAVSFRYRALDTMIGVDGEDLSLLTAALNAVSLIVGFMMFTAIRRSTQFDRRLILAGYPAGLLILAKVTMLVIISAAIAVYAAAVLRIFWAPDLWAGLVASLFVASLAYGGLGILIGVLLPGELEGMFLIIMISLIDTLIQNPIGNPFANRDMVMYFPTYGPMQFGVGAGFADSHPVRYLGVGMLWLLGLAVCGLVTLRVRTRVQGGHRVEGGPRVHSDDDGSAIRSAGDGS